MKRKQTTYDAGLAFRIREDKARQGDTFKAAYAAAEAAALDVAIRWSTADLQAAGGWTAVVTAAFDAVAQGATYPGPFDLPTRLRLHAADHQDIRLAAMKQALGMRS